MVTRCLFGIFVFETNSSVIYRFLTDDLYAHLRQCFKARKYKLNDDPIEDDQSNNIRDDEPRLSFDDAISQHLSVLLRVREQTSECQDPIRRITLETGIQVFFDQITDHNIICMADKSFDTIIVLKSINLLKALIKFHIGALPFIHFNAADKLIDRISASLQYFLNNVTTNQALLFESCEHLHINSLIREQCRQACTVISNDIQNSLKVQRKIILITCNNKILHMYMSNNQSPPNNADIFLLVLNNTSRPLRKEFETQIHMSNVMAHRFERKKNNRDFTFQTSARTSTASSNSSLSDLVNSCPNLSSSQFTTSTERSEKKTHRSEVVFLKTSDKAIAPFTLFTIPLTDNISVLILVEWENSAVCSNLYELIRHLDSNTIHAAFPYNKLNRLIKSVESSAAVRKYFENNSYPSNILTDILNNAHTLHKSSKRTNQNDDEKRQNAFRILRKLTEMSSLATDAFRHLFFDSDEYARRSGIDIDKDQETFVQMDGIGSNDNRNRKNEYDTSPTTKLIRKKLILRLEDWFSFVEVKSQRNITMNFCHDQFPGLVHFVFIDRLRGQICTPTLIIDDYQNHTLTNNSTDESEYILEKKILAFELECLSALQHGFTSYTMSDEHFTYNYTLRLQESNGASMRLYKSFVQTQPPGVLHSDFYKTLADEYYPRLTYQSIVACFELISVHLRIVPPGIVRKQCEQLWPRLMEPNE